MLYHYPACPDNPCFDKLTMIHQFEFKEKGMKKKMGYEENCRNPLIFIGRGEQI